LCEAAKRSRLEQGISQLAMIKKVGGASRRVGQRSKKLRLVSRNTVLGRISMPVHAPGKNWDCAASKYSPMTKTLFPPSVKELGFLCGRVADQKLILAKIIGHFLRVADPHPLQ
jgi:hypothetical protein